MNSEKHLPGVEAMLRRCFPQLVMLQGADAPKAAFAECDSLLHGSSPSLVAERGVARWRSETDKSCGAGGITLSSCDYRANR